jgi:hypothetical protein
MMACIYCNLGTGNHAVLQLLQQGLLLCVAYMLRQQALLGKHEAGGIGPVLEMAQDRQSAAVCQSTSCSYFWQI